MARISRFWPRFMLVLVALFGSAFGLNMRPCLQARDTTVSPALPALRPRQTADVVVTSEVLVTTLPSAGPPVIVTSTMTATPPPASTVSSSSSSKSTSSTSTQTPLPTPKPTSPTSSPTSQIKGGIIGAIAAAGAIAVFVVGIVVWLTMRRLKRRGNCEPAYPWQRRRHRGSAQNVAAATTNYFDPNAPPMKSPLSSGRQNMSEYFPPPVVKPSPVKDPGPVDYGRNGRGGSGHDGGGVYTELPVRSPARSPATSPPPTGVGGFRPAEMDTNAARPPVVPSNRYYYSSGSGGGHEPGLYEMSGGGEPREDPGRNHRRWPGAGTFHLLRKGSHGRGSGRAYGASHF